MKKLSDMKVGDTGKVIYLPYNFYNVSLKRFDHIKVILNLFGNKLIKSESGLTFIGREASSQITCD